ncbi:MAG: tRNA 2-thiocytidine(32) synthetase TtcA [Firmicutes bacterium]|nr:tRNA 2-thiocytidine(32) synthetase TtcA [Bacillota bacterium]
MNLQNLLSQVRRACEDRNMIVDGDKVAVGLSGGKDSLALLTALARFQKFSPKKFELAAVTVDLGFPASLSEKETAKSKSRKKADPFLPLKEYCKSLSVPFYIIPSNIYSVVFEIRKEKNPCSLCSKMRRGILNTWLKENNFTKLALGHHADDLVETMLLSLFYEGRLSTFQPVSYMSQSSITLIRPLIYVYEKDLAAFSKTLPVMKNPCPANGGTERESMKNLIKSICKDIPIAKDRMFSALTHPERNNLWEVL